jgi:aminopeptidase N
VSLTPNLTRDQAADRAATLAVESYRIDLDLTDGAGGPGEKTFATRSEIRFTARPGASTFLDFVGDGIASATLNGEPLDIGGWSNTAGLALDGLAADNVVVVEAVGLYTNTGEGLHRFVDPVDGAVYLYSQFETADAKRLYPCFDQPDLKATFAVTVTAPADWQVVSNGATVEIADGLSGSKVHRFATTPRMSTYVTALVAGPYRRGPSDPSRRHLL